MVTLTRVFPRGWFRCPPCLRKPSFFAEDDQVACRRACRRRAPGSLGRAAGNEALLATENGGGRSFSRRLSLAPILPSGQVSRPTRTTVMNHVAVVDVIGGVTKHDMAVVITGNRIMDAGT
jgi:hypothetical protein